MKYIILKLQPWIMHRYYGYGHGYVILEVIFWILVLIGLAILIKYLLPKGFVHGFAQEYDILKKESAYDILKKRYAKGEISKEEFEDIKKDI